MPSHGPVFFALLIGATAVIGAVVSSTITVQVIRTDLTRYVQDYLAYGLLPALAYLALLAASAMIYLDRAYALEVLAGALLTLAIVNIRNAWDLTLSMVHRHAAKKNNQSSARTVTLVPAPPWQAASRRRAPWRRCCTGWRAASRRLG